MSKDIPVKHDDILELRKGIAIAKLNGKWELVKIMKKDRIIPILDLDEDVEKVLSELSDQAEFVAELSDKVRKKEEGV